MNLIHKYSIIRDKCYLCVKLHDNLQLTCGNSSTACSCFCCIGYSFCAENDHPNIYFQ
ncbi:unnamed protein product [Spodoptera littoralis]|uniref:Uncharacterized protein n=1 Tax=Spodoptera littoralis TaxID=7109 RepID=A0A9P0HUJ4_SPOLI|nr:unnamed protein product [Spodoptera littoralis]CAH1635573.1 unnamed protein product [Spodoptera littoralis]